MTKEELDKLWGEVNHICSVLQLEYDARVSLGSVFGRMRTEIEKLQGECSHKNVTSWNHGYHNKCLDCGERDVNR
jgi:hypothetical protein